MLSAAESSLLEKGFVKEVSAKGILQVSTMAAGILLGFNLTGIFTGRLPCQRFYYRSFASCRAFDLKSSYGVYYHVERCCCFFVKNNPQSLTAAKPATKVPATEVSRLQRERKMWENKYVVGMHITVEDLKPQIAYASSRWTAGTGHASKREEGFCRLGLVC